MLSRVASCVRICQRQLTSQTRVGAISLPRLFSGTAWTAKDTTGSTQHVQQRLDDGSLFISRVPAAFITEDPQAFTKQQNRESAGVDAADLPPPLREPPESKYHLTKADIEEIRRLRNEDPAHWTRKRLAEKYQCTPVFIGMVAKCPEWRIQEIQAESERKWLRMGYKRRLIKINRIRRRMAW